MKLIKPLLLAGMLVLAVACQPLPSDGQWYRYSGANNTGDYANIHGAPSNCAAAPNLTMQATVSSYVQYGGDGNVVRFPAQNLCVAGVATGVSLLGWTTNNPGIVIDVDARCTGAPDGVCPISIGLIGQTNGVRQQIA